MVYTVCSKTVGKVRGKADTARDMGPAYHMHSVVGWPMRVQ